MKARFWHKGISYDPSKPDAWPSDLPYRDDLQKLITAYLARAPYTIKTSGSTGKPKKIVHRFEDVLASARATANFFILPAGSKALLNLPVNRVAGGMMVYRSLVNDWDLYLEEASATPLASASLPEQLDLVAMTPYQAKRSLEEQPGDMKRIRTLLLGGAPVRPPLIRALQGKVQQAYETYGMTETLTHIAVKRLAPEPQDFFTCLPGIRVEEADQGTLVIHSDRLPESIHTTDLADVFTENTFRWIGRSDFTINSGGVKIQPEQIEDIISDLIDGRYLIASESDSDFGQRVILLLEGQPLSESEEATLMQQLRDRLHPHSCPRALRYRDAFILTPNGKVKRPQA